MEIISGIYKITNNLNGHSYIGSSQDIYRRWTEHSYLLSRKLHHSRYLQHAYNKYGADAFSYEIVLICDIDNLLYYEQVFLDRLSCVYNICRHAGSTRGVPLTEEVKERLRRNYDDKKPEDYYWYGKKRRPETIKKIAEANRGNHHTENHKSKISKVLKGRKKSQETIRNMRIAQSKKSDLSKSDVLLIRAMEKEAEFDYGDKMAFCRFWGKKFGAHYRAVQRVINNDTWKHILEA